MGERLRGEILPVGCAKLMELINVKIIGLEQSIYIMFAPTKVLPSHPIITVRQVIYVPPRISGLVTILSVPSFAA